MSEEREPAPEELEQDDAVIGRAFKLSLMVFVALGALVAAGVWLVGGGGAEPETREVEVGAPRAIESEAEAPEVRFVDVTRAAGVVFERFNGAAGDKFLPETMGGGCAFLDFDTDGDADLLLVNGAPWDPESAERPIQALYANDGAGRFTDVAREAGLALTFQGMGAAVGDADGDGDPDLFLTGVGRNVLLRNDNGSFVDVTAEAGIGQDPERWCTSATFFDADADGDLDLFACSYVRWSPEIDRGIDYRLTGVGKAYGPPMNYPGDHSLFYRNEGDWRFVERSLEAGLRVTNPATGVFEGKALGVVALDVDDDGDQDLVVANDTIRNFLFVNRGDGTFDELGFDAGLAYDRNGKATGAMGIDAASFRADGLLGFAIGNFANEMSSLYVAEGRRLLFTDESIVAGIGAPSRRYLSFGIFFFDYDLDGRLDLLQANGHLEDEIEKVQPSQSYAQPAQLFWNAGPDARATFVEVPPERAGDLLARPIVGRGAGCADIDGDGDLDVLLTQCSGGPRLFRNDPPPGHHWLRVRLEGRRANREGLGAWIELTAGGVTQRRLVTRAKSYLTQVLADVTFGLGREAAAQRLVVRWPGGGVQEILVEGVDREVVVAEE